MKVSAANSKTFPLDSSLDVATMLASSIHDIKNSLGLLLHDIDDLADACSIAGESGQSEIVSKLQSNARHISSQLIQLLTLYKFDAGTCTLHPSHINVAEFLEDCQVENASNAEQRNIQIDYDALSNLYWTLDRDMIASVVNNAVGNALRYAQHEVKLTAHQEGDGLQIDVVDDGPGFPKEVLCQTSDYAGDVDFISGNTGLGVYFATEVVHRHTNNNRKGIIRLSNDGINGGGRFSIWLP